MLIFIKRLIVLILIPAGLVLLFIPLDTSRRTYMEKDFVFLIAGSASPEERKLDNIPQLTREQLEPYSHILNAILERKEHVETYRPSPKVADDILGLKSLGNTLSQMGGVLPEEAKKYKKDLDQRRKSIRDSENEMHKIRRTGFSYLQKQWETEATSILIEEWEQMKESLSFSDNEQTLFLFENTLFQGIVRYD